jgi:cyanophycinase
MMAGPLALVGSGEFLADTEAVDQALLAAARRRHGPVLVVPTASALEPGMPRQWAERGIRHFTRLGVPVAAAMVLDRAGADDPALVAPVAGARLVYFSGGNPRYVTQTIVGSSFWRAVLAAWQDGAALAGCSAGAMMLGAVIQSITGRDASPLTAGGIVPGVAVIPHFDRIERWRPGATAAVRAARSPGVTLVGIDERTAALFHTGRWEVMGAGKVLVVADDGEAVYSAGQSLPLPVPAAPRCGDGAGPRAG